MTEFPRLLRSGSPAQRLMLEAAQDDAPSASSQHRLVLALGLGSAALSMETLARAASNVRDASTPTASASPSVALSSGIGEAAVSGAPTMVAPAGAALVAPAATISAALVAKWLVVASLSLTAVGAGVVVGRAAAQRGTPRSTAALDGNASRARQTSSSPDSSNEPSKREPRTASAARTDHTLPLPPPNNDLGSGSTEVQAGTRSASLRLNASRPGLDRLTVSDEISLVEKARAALRRGDPATCLSVLEIRRKGVRGGVLAPEAAILHIEALRALGQRERATQEAIQFAHNYPGSPLIDRIRDLFPSSEP